MHSACLGCLTGSHRVCRVWECPPSCLWDLQPWGMLRGVCSRYHAGARRHRLGKALSLVREEAQTSRQDRLPWCLHRRMCQRGLSPVVGQPSFHSLHWKGRSLNFSEFAFPLLYNLGWESFKALSCPAWVHGRTALGWWPPGGLLQENCLFWVNLCVPLD